jgi:hypothetical protein
MGGWEEWGVGRLWIGNERERKGEIKREVFGRNGRIRA